MVEVKFRATIRTGLARAKGIDMKKVLLLLCLSLVPVLALAQAPVASTKADDAIDLRSERCVQVKPGDTIRFRFEMLLDKPLPEQANYNAYPQFFKTPFGPPPMGFSEALPVQMRSVTRQAGSDTWEYIGMIQRTARSGDYQMTNLSANFNYVDGGQQLSSNASLTDEALREIQKYHVCVADGFIPIEPAKGRIVKVEPVM